MRYEVYAFTPFHGYADACYAITRTASCPMDVAEVFMLAYVILTIPLDALAAEERRRCRC